MTDPTTKRTTARIARSLSSRIPRHALAFGILAACSQMAMAQAAAPTSSVTLSGILDIGPRIDFGSRAGSIKSVASGQMFGSRIDFIGVEDLGGGLKVGFVLESGIGLDTGEGIANPPGATGFSWGRTSAISIGSDSTGYLSMGRQYTPLWALSASGSNDPFVGSWLGGQNVVYSNTVLASNSIVYSYGYTVRTMLQAAPRQGFGLAALYSLGEQAAPLSKAGRQMGINASYGTGPFFVGYAFHQLDGVSPATSATAPVSTRPRLRQQTLSTAYDFGFARLHVGLNSGRNDAVGATALSRRSWTVGATIPLPPNQSVRVLYGRANDRTAANADWAMFQIGYYYDFSRRTALYAAFGTVDNNANAAVTMARALGTYDRGSTPRSLMTGVRHFF